MENISKYLDTIELSEGINKDEVLNVASHIVAEIEACILQNKSRGLFKPLSIEVKN